MSKLKTPDNATLPEPVVSPRRDLRRQKARGRKMVPTAQSRGARKAKERTMPKKPKPEPKADERRRKLLARALLKKLNENNCEQYGISKVDISRLREVAYGAR